MNYMETHLVRCSSTEIPTAAGFHVDHDTRGVVVDGVGAAGDRALCAAADGFTTPAITYSTPANV